MRATTRGLRTVLLCSVIAPLALAARAVAAPVTIGGFVFDANAAADAVTLVPGADPTFYLCGATSDDGAPTLPGLSAAQSANRVVTDGIADAEMFGRAVVDVAFVDNVVVNGAGPDLVVFESGFPEAFSVSIFDPITSAFSAPHTFTPAPTGSLGGCGFQLNAAQIDLSDFGVELGTARSLVRIDNLGPTAGCCDGADLMDVLALNSGAPASEPLGLPGASFESNSGADVASVVPGSIPTFFLCGVTSESGEPTLPGLTPDQSATLVVSNGSADDEVFGKAVLDVGFTDNVIVNGTGPDVAVFESGRPEAFSVSVFDPVAHAFTAPRIYEPSPTGSYDRCGFPVNVAQIDLSAFGIARLAAVSLLRIDNLGAAGGFDGADIADVRALHSAVPLSLSVRGTLNLKSKGLLSVVLLSTATFDTLSVDSATVTLGDPDATGTAGPVSVATEDVNGDGRLDLLLAFSIPDLLKAGALTSTTDRVVVSGQTFDGRTVLGSASVRIVRSR